MYRQLNVQPGSNISLLLTTHWSELVTRLPTWSHESVMCLEIGDIRNICAETIALMTASNNGLSL